jgi:hypothetical protein
MYTGQYLSGLQAGTFSVAAGTGAYVYSGPAFAHNLDASSSVRGIGDCFGYVAISDSMRPHY